MVAKILVVDDASTDRLIIANMLSGYQMLTANNGLEALKVIDKNLDVDLIILDLNMPVMNGFELLEVMKENPKYTNLRTIILTNHDEIENEVKGLKLGAVDFIRKPLNSESLRLRIDFNIKLKEAQLIIEENNQFLDAKVEQKTRELIVTRNVTIHALVGLLEVRNIESSKHTIRTQLIMKLLCNHLKEKEKYQEVLTDEYIADIVATTPLHDIGKVGIPDSILLKPGKLTAEEYEIMKKHVEYGVQALKDELQDDQDIPSFINTAIEIVGGHHEKYDGSGYPNKLAGDKITLPGRLMAIIDVYDALMSKRVYKPAYDLSYTIDYLKSESGKHFDPDILQGFMEIKNDIYEVTITYFQGDTLNTKGRGG